MLGRIKRKSTAECFWDITKHFFIVIVTLHNSRSSGLVSKRFSKLFFCLGNICPWPFSVEKNYRTVKFSQCVALCGEAITLMTVMWCKNASLQRKLQWRTTGHMRQNLPQCVHCHPILMKWHVFMYNNFSLFYTIR